MEKFTFKTNINCYFCRSSVTPFLNSEPRITRWEIDLESTDKILIVEGENITKKEIIELIYNAGYRAGEL